MCMRTPDLLQVNDVHAHGLKAYMYVCCVCDRLLTQRYWSRILPGLERIGKMLRSLCGGNLEKIEEGLPRLGKARALVSLSESGLWKVDREADVNSLSRM